MHLLRSIHDALEPYLPLIEDESDRQEALKYLRGLKSVLGTSLDTAEPFVIQFGNDQTRRRWAGVIAATQIRQIVDAHRLHQLTLYEFCSENLDDIN